MLFLAQTDSAWDTSSIQFRSFEDDAAHRPVVPEPDKAGLFLVGFCILMVLISFTRRAIKQRDQFPS